MKLTLLLLLSWLFFASCSQVEEIKVKTWSQNGEIKNISEDLNDKNILEKSSSWDFIKQESLVKTQTWENINLLEWEKVKDNFDKKEILETSDVLKKEENKIPEKKDGNLEENISETKENLKTEKKDSEKVTQEEEKEVSEKIKSCKDDSCKTKILVKESLEKNNTSVCDTLKWDKKDKCKSEALINLAIKNMDKKLCEKIPLDSEKETCNQILKAIIWK